MKKRSVLALLLASILIGIGGIYLGTSSTNSTNLNQTRIYEQTDANNITIGVITSTSRVYQTYKPFVEEIITKDVNKYAESVDSPLQFEFILENADSQAAIHLEKTASFKEMDIRLLIGGMWSSQACASLSYCNENDMLLVSPSSTSPLKAISSDNLFRLCTTDVKIAPALVSILNSRNIEAVVVIQRGDSWADLLLKNYQPLFEAQGGTVIESIRYPAESTSFHEYLDLAEKAVSEAVNEYGWDGVAVQFFGFSEVVYMIQEAKQYPSLYNVTWFGSDNTHSSDRFIDDSPEESVQLSLVGITPVLQDSDEARDVLLRFQNQTGTICDYYTAITYDIAMIYAQSVIRVGGDEVESIKTAFREISEDYVGITGECKLDEFDDRYSCIYNVYSYEEVEGGVESMLIGRISENNVVSWVND